MQMSSIVAGNDERHEILCMSMVNESLLRVVGQFQEDLFHALHVVVQELLDAECFEEERYRCHAETACQWRTRVVSDKRQAHFLFSRITTL